MSEKIPPRNENLENEQPNRNPFLRAPLPPTVTPADPDALRQFYRPDIPQYRLPTISGISPGVI